MAVCVYGVLAAGEEGERERKKITSAPISQGAFSSLSLWRLVMSHARAQKLIRIERDETIKTRNAFDSRPSPFYGFPLSFRAVKRPGDTLCISRSRRDHTHAERGGFSFASMTLSLSRPQEIKDRTKAIMVSRLKCSFRRSWPWRVHSVGPGSSYQHEYAVLLSPLINLTFATKK